MSFPRSHFPAEHFPPENFPDVEEGGGEENPPGPADPQPEVQGGTGPRRKLGIGPR